MITSRSPRVPIARRAERTGFGEFQARGVWPRRTALRAVYCPRCAQHRTIVIDVATWQPTGGVPHVVCAVCAGATS